MNVLKLLLSMPLKLLSLLFLSLIRCYRVCISPLLPNSCRFYPSCSHYSYEAIERHGPIKGFILSAARILKCNPLHPGGHDPVPEEFHFCKHD